MAQVPITIDRSGNPTPQYPHVQKGDQVYWIAEDPTQTWYIRFPSPFAEDIIVNDQHGRTRSKTVHKVPGTYFYLVEANDPRLSKRRTKSRVRPFTSGGGIIVDA